MAAAGALDHEELVALVEKATEHVNPAEPAQEIPNPSFHTQEKRISRDTEQVHLCLALPGTSHTHRDRYTMALCDTLLGGSTSSRLFQEIRENRGLAYSIGSYSILCRNTGLFLIHAGTANENLSEVLGLIRAELDKLQRNGVSEEDLSQAKSHVHGSLALARESTSFRMQRLANGMLYEGKVVSHRRLLHRFERISAEDIGRVAKRSFSADPTIVALGPLE
ncbi:MAG: hypothetical protein GTO55_06495 [Armatimonadetes bacterium]|nr:hypothetical protein [Armatimonadota bacterium]NIM23932.1 hypothetical protein [Armatimonadota bacterium]NIM67779.1 hypothetical protein [Armatimonadota bacterium]NIM76319.1 hypothetical protein [Armatimonadota bacterium]NIN06013.1 hypothetical protein [Armatimonadota bacterium]